MPKKNFDIDYHLPLILILGLFPSMIMISLIASQNGFPQAQGRYLFVTIPFLFYLIALVANRADAFFKNNRSNN